MFFSSKSIKLTKICRNSNADFRFFDTTKNAYHSTNFVATTSKSISTTKKQISNTLTINTDIQQQILNKPTLRSLFKRFQSTSKPQIEKKTDLKQDVPTGNSEKPATSSWWRELFLREKPAPKSNLGWWWDKLLLMVIFGITGSATVYFVKPLLTDYLKLEG